MRLKIESTPLLLELDNDVLVRAWAARTGAGVRCKAFIPEIHPALPPDVLRLVEAQDDGSGTPARLELEHTDRIVTIGNTTQARVWNILEGGRGDFYVVALQVEREDDLAEFERELRLLSQTPGGICARCGCSDLDACEGGCAWVDERHTLCSSCIGVEA